MRHPRSNITIALAALTVTLLLTTVSTGRAQSAELRPLADDAGIHLGAAVDVDALDDSGYTQLLVENVNMLSTRDDMSMPVVQPEQGVFDFSRGDAIVDFAVEHDMAVRGHGLIGPDAPAWVLDGTWTAETLGDVLREHVTSVIGHYVDRYPGVITQWDVVGDAVLPDGTPRPTIWQQVIGDDYLRIAFEAARAADPDVQLFYDDFYDDLAVTQDAVAIDAPIVPGATAERTTCDAVAKCIGVRDMIAGLLAAGTPIDGVGFQAHLFSPDPSDFTQFSAWVEELGLRWAVTEFDVPLPVTETANADSLAFQASVYADALTACADATNCDTFVTWGISDRFSPIPAETGGAFDGALWFDTADVPKPALDAMRQVLTERVVATTTVPASIPTVPASSTTTAEAVDTADSGTGSTLVAALIAVGALGAIGALIVVARRKRATSTR